MTKRILIMGLPGSGKTTLALSLIRDLHKLGKSIEWLNADDVRKQYNDWDFSNEGRLRQANRMRDLADKSRAEFVIADFVAPLLEMREIYDPDYTVWMDTIEAGRFEDTNRAFVEPIAWDLRVNGFNAEYWATFFVSTILELGNSVG